jgi:hypothetical protein
MSSRNIRPPSSFWVVLLTVIGFSLALVKQGLAACDDDILPNTPLNDLWPGLYQGYPGGLYTNPNGSNQRPEPYNADGINIATNKIFPRGPGGNKNLTSGKVVIVSIGMCNSLMEFGGDDPPDPQSFIPRAQLTVDPSLNQKLVIVNGAQAGADAPAWTDSASEAWNNLLDPDPQHGFLARAGVTPNQVQVVWLKEAWIFRLRQRSPQTLSAAAISWPCHRPAKRSRGNNTKHQNKFSQLSNYIPFTAHTGLYS